MSFGRDEGLVKANFARKLRELIVKYHQDPSQLAMQVKSLKQSYLRAFPHTKNDTIPLIKTREMVAFAVKEHPHKSHPKERRNIEWKAEKELNEFYEDHDPILQTCVLLESLANEDYFKKKQHEGFGGRFLDYLIKTQTGVLNKFILENDPKYTKSASNPKKVAEAKPAKKGFWSKFLKRENKEQIEKMKADFARELRKLITEYFKDPSQLAAAAKKLKEKYLRKIPNSHEEVVLSFTTRQVRAFSIANHPDNSHPKTRADIAYQAREKLDELYKNRDPVLTTCALLEYLGNKNNPSFQEERIDNKKNAYSRDFLYYLVESGEGVLNKFILDTDPKYTEPRMRPGI